MKRNLLMLMLAALLAITAFSQSQPAATPQPSQSAQSGQAAQAHRPPAAPPTVTQLLDRQLMGLERNFVSAADAMPEDKFDWRPPATQGAFGDVKTFRQQVLHVAINNFLFADTLLGQETKAKAEDREMGPKDITTKAAAIQYLKDSFAAAHKAIQTVNEQNVTEMVQLAGMQNRMPRMSLANIFTWHGYDHYGQMVVYLRMNNIVPPASRPREGGD